MPIFGIDDALIGGALALGSGIASGAMGASAQRDTNRMNYRMFKEGQTHNIHSMKEASRIRQSEAMNMASQIPAKQMEGLKAAGLNPMLAITKPQGMSSSGGAALASPNAPEMKSPTGSGLSSAMDSMRLFKELKAVDAQADKQKSEAKLAQKQTEISEIERQAREAKLPAVKKHAKYDLEASAWDAFMKRIGFGASTATSVRRNFQKHRR